MLTHLCYYCFMKFGILPHTIYNLSQSEQALLSAFYVIYMGKTS